MNATTLRTELNHFRKWLSTNSTSNAYALPAVAETNPASLGAIGMSLPGGMGKSLGNSLILAPFGTDAADETFGVRLYGFRRMGPAPSGGVGDPAGYWVAIPILAFTATLGTGTGVAGASVTNTDFFADEISAITGTQAYDAPAVPANTRAWITVDVKGFEYVLPDISVGTAASGNFLWTVV